MIYAVRYEETAQKQLDKLDANTRKRIKKVG